MAPGNWSKIDTNKWRNTQTGDVIELKKYRDVAGDPSTRRWHILYNGQSGIDAPTTIPNINVGEKKASVVQKAKQVMRSNTVSNIRQEKQRQENKLFALREAKQTAKSRSAKASKNDNERRNQDVGSTSDVDDVERWADDPGRMDLFGVDTPGSSKSKDEQVELFEERIEGIEEQLDDERFDSL